MKIVTPNICQALKRLTCDLRPFASPDTCPPNISLAQPYPETDPFILIGNIIPAYGIYKSLLFHFQLTIPQNYPLSPPRMLLQKGQDLNKGFRHEHVFGHSMYGYRVCIDILDDFSSWFQWVDRESDKEQKHSGWTSAYDLVGITMQLQIFLSEPDLPKQLRPTLHQVIHQKNVLEKFVIEYNDDNGKVYKHSFNEPWPPILVPLDELIVPNLKDTSKQKEKQDQDVLKQKRKQQKKQLALSRLTCFLLKDNIETDTQIILGYPIQLTRDKFERLHFTVFLELLSYQGYETLYSEHMRKNKNIVVNFDTIQLKTSSNDTFNYWFPIYQSSQHYKRAFHNKIIQHSLNLLYDGKNAKTDLNFKAILKVIPSLMNKMIVALQDGKMHQSIAAIEAYCHFLRLFLHFLQEYPQLQILIDQKVQNIISDKSLQSWNKENLGDMGEFLILLAFSNCKLDNTKIWETLIKEYLARQVSWVIDKFKKENEKNEFSLLNFSIVDYPIQDFFQTVKVSNHLLIFNFVALLEFLNDRDIFIQKLEKNHGTIKQAQATQFISRLKSLTKQITSYQSLIDFIGLGEIYNTPEKVESLLQEAKLIALQQQYIKLNQFPNSQGFQIAVYHFSNKNVLNLSVYPIFKFFVRKLMKIAQKLCIYIISHSESDETYQSLVSNFINTLEQFNTIRHNNKIIENLLRKDLQNFNFNLSALNYNTLFNILEPFTYMFLLNLNSKEQKYVIPKLWLLEFFSREFYYAFEKQQQNQLFVHYKMFFKLQEQINVWIKKLKETFYYPIELFTQIQSLNNCDEIQNKLNDFQIFSNVFKSFNIDNELKDINNLLVQSYHHGIEQDYYYKGEQICVQSSIPQFVCLITNSKNQEITEFFLQESIVQETLTLIFQQTKQFNFEENLSKVAIKSFGEAWLFLINFLDHCEPELNLLINNTTKILKNFQSLAKVEYLGPFIINLYILASKQLQQKSKIDFQNALQLIIEEIIARQIKLLLLKNKNIVRMYLDIVVIHPLQQLFDSVLLQNQMILQNLTACQYINSTQDFYERFLEHQSLDEDFINQIFHQISTNSESVKSYPDMLKIVNLKEKILSKINENELFDKCMLHAYNQGYTKDQLRVTFKSKEEVYQYLFPS